MTNTLNRWLPALTLGVWGVLMLYFHLSGRLSAFLHPMFRPGVLVAGVLLAVLAIGFILGGGDDCCEDDACAHRFSRLTLGKLLTFAVILLPGSLVLFSEDGFSLTTIQNRGMVTDATELIRPPGALELPSGGEAGENLPISVIDLLYAAQEPTLQQEFSQRKLEVVGQLMAATESNARGNRMRLVRMFMNCCAADAKPVGALIELKEPVTLPELSWVKVTGSARFLMEGGRTLSVLQVESIEPAAPPDESMLF